MSTSTKADSNRRGQLSYREFAVKHKSELAEADDIIGWSPRNSSDTNTLAQVFKLTPRAPLPRSMQELQRTSFFRLLAAAGQENCPDALNSLLYFWLRRMGVRIPEGVFVEPRGTPGRPRSTSGVYTFGFCFPHPPLGKPTLGLFF